jgi:hypothetical protein
MLETHAVFFTLCSSSGANKDSEKSLFKKLEMAQVCTYARNGKLQKEGEKTLSVARVTR